MDGLLIDTDFDISEADMKIHRSADLPCRKVQSESTHQTKLTVTSSSDGKQNNDIRKINRFKFKRTSNGISDNNINQLRSHSSVYNEKTKEATTTKSSDTVLHDAGCEGNEINNDPGLENSVDIFSSLIADDFDDDIFSNIDIVTEKNESIKSPDRHAMSNDNLRLGNHEQVTSDQKSNKRLHAPQTQILRLAHHKRDEKQTLRNQVVERSNHSSKENEIFPSSKKPKIASPTDTPQTDATRRHSTNAQQQIRIPISHVTPKSKHPEQSNLRNSARKACHQYTTPNILKYTKRRFPGPAGNLPALTNETPLNPLRSPPELVKEKRPLTPRTPSTTPLPNVMNLSQGNELHSELWTEMKEYVDKKFGDSTDDICSILNKATKKQLNKSKVDIFYGIVRSFSVLGSAGKMILKDSSGEISCAVHRNVLKEHQDVLKSGTGMVLRDVSVYSPTLKKHYVNITPSNIDRFFLSCQSNDSFTQTQSDCETTCVEPSTYSQENVVVEGRRLLFKDNNDAERIIRDE